MSAFSTPTQCLTFGVVEIDASAIRLQPEPASEPNCGRGIFLLARRRSGFSGPCSRCDNDRVGRTDRVGGDNLRHGARTQGQIVEEVRFTPEGEKGCVPRHSRQVCIYAAGTHRRTGTKGWKIFAVVSGVEWPPLQTDPDVRVGLRIHARCGQEETVDSRTQIVDTFVFSGARNALDESAEEDW